MKFMVKMHLSWVVLCLTVFFSEAFFIKRSTDMTICSSSTPCGWELYEAYSRTVTNFVKSPCDCPTDTHCIRWYDDLSKAAYVLRCINISSEVPATSNHS
ncbi:uncharacterized protein [Parasteatoda tepidariorum]|uniref:uncharacterized protein n=1 Tax=Parasteatoda tepidariorum TaxID=114398 RepID=UPI0039BD30DE